MEKRILITGACGVTSRSLVRSLRKSSFFGKDELVFVGTDICNLLYAPFEGLYSKIYKVPPYNDPDYRDVMNRIIREERLDFAFVIPEPESLYWSEHPFENISFMAIPPKFGKAVLSKRRLYENLSGTGLVPSFQIVTAKEILKGGLSFQLNFPMWIRDYAEGGTSGKGSYLAKDIDSLKAWALINENVDTFMLAEYLPGRNYACFLSYKNGELLQYGVAERIDYLMGKVSVSGITGNTSYGKLLNDKAPFEIALSGVNKILEKTKEVMNGLIVVDLKANADEKPLITEINLRHVAFTSTFANAGLNFAEGQMLCMLNRENEIPIRGTKIFPANNAMLRDVDGLPIFIDNLAIPKVGDYFK